VLNHHATKDVLGSCGIDPRINHGIKWKRAVRARFDTFISGKESSASAGGSWISPKGGLEAAVKIKLPASPGNRTLGI
jgi:hypothetical protein